MAKGFIGGIGHKAYLGAAKFKAGYIGTQKVYSSGCMVTYVYGSKAAAQVEYEEGDIISNFKAISLASGYALVGWTDSPTNSSGNWVPKTIKASGEAVTLYAITRKTISGYTNIYNDPIYLYGLSVGASISVIGSGVNDADDGDFEKIRVCIRNPLSSEVVVYYGTDVNSGQISTANLNLTAKGANLEARVSGSGVNRNISLRVTSYNYTVG